MLESQDPDALASASAVLLRAGWRLVEGVHPPDKGSRFFRAVVAPPSESSEESRAALEDALRMISIPPFGDSNGGSD